jgi:hypothetical protein
VHASLGGTAWQAALVHPASVLQYAWRQSRAQHRCSAAGLASGGAQARTDLPTPHYTPAAADIAPP